MTKPLPLCRDCGEPFTLRPGKPGYINQCEGCATDEPLIGGNMIYEHKTAGFVELKPLAAAKQFNRLGRRRGGQGVIANLVNGA